MDFIYLGLSIPVVRFSQFNQPRFMSELDVQIPTAFGTFSFPKNCFLYEIDWHLAAFELGINDF